jgi:SulP family sulfate permease
MLGFVNGLAIVIGLAQLEQFRTHDANDDAVWMSGALLNMTMILIVATMVLIWLTPRVTKLIPAPLVAIGVVTGVVLGL